MGSSTLFLVEDKLCEKSDYHGWKMSLDLTLEDQEVLDHVRGNIIESPSNASVAARNKWKSEEVKAKKIIRDSIDKRLVTYVSELNTSKEIYDRLDRLDQRVEEKDDATIAINQVIVQGSVPIKGTHTGMMIKIPLKAIKEMVGQMFEDEYYLPAALSTSAPPDSLGNWLIDSGALRHFTGYKEVLHNLIEKETNLEIVLGDNMKYPVKGIGNVSLKLNQGNTIHLQDVLYVPDLKKNLVSISTMEDKGYKVAFSDGKRLALPYIPEQHGVAERNNRTIMEAVCAMLHDQRLLKFLWVEAANTAVYIQNQCPHQALGS
eukprot:PITA_30289